MIQKQLPNTHSSFVQFSYLSHPLFPILKNIFQIDVLETVKTLWQVGKRLQHLPGLYEVLEYDTRLELLDNKGKIAKFYKHQKVRFLQDNIIAYQDQAWGDGNIFADYHCSPGIPVDRYQEGHRYRILISLRETKQRGDIEDFYIERRIEEGFKKQVEYFQTAVDHVTRHLTITVIFPKTRLPKRVVLVEHRTSRTTSASDNTLQTLPDGRQQVKWVIQKPKLFEQYSIRWEW